MPVSATRTWLFILLCALYLSACGFRLAGTSQLPAQYASIYLQTTDFSGAQRRVLQDSLTASGATLVDDKDAAAIRLGVKLNLLPDQRIATSASSGDVVKRISRSLDFSVKDSAGKNLVEPRTLRQHRDVTLDDDSLLAANREKETVGLEIEKALYDQLIRQLTRL